MLMFFFISWLQNKAIEYFTKKEIDSNLRAIRKSSNIPNALWGGGTVTFWRSTVRRRQIRLRIRSSVSKRCICLCGYSNADVRSYRQYFGILRSTIRKSFPPSRIACLPSRSQIAISSRVDSGSVFLRRRCSRHFGSFRVLRRFSLYVSERFFRSAHAPTAYFIVLFTVFAYCYRKVLYVFKRHRCLHKIHTVGRKRLRF